MNYPMLSRCPRLQILLNERDATVGSAVVIDVCLHAKDSFYIGWLNCVKLSSNGGYNNADSYAYFALGKWVEYCFYQDDNS